jgi:hypothetical protein
MNLTMRRMKTSCNDAGGIKIMCSHIVHPDPIFRISKKLAFHHNRVPKSDESMSIHLLQFKLQKWTWAFLHMRMHLTEACDKMERQ